MYPLPHDHFGNMGNVIGPTLELLAEAQMVVGLRLAGMAGIWPVGLDETHRMLSEKGPALLGAANDAHTAALSGQRLDQILLAAITPLTGAARNNRLRLSAPRG